MSAQNFGAKGDDEHLRFIRENVRYKKLILAGTKIGNYCEIKYFLVFKQMLKLPV